MAASQYNEYMFGPDWTKVCQSIYQNVKDHKTRYAVLKLDVRKSQKLISDFEDGDKDIEFSSAHKGREVDEKTKAGLQKLSAYLSEHASNEPRYVLFDFAFSNEQKTWNNPIFIKWSPATPEMGIKMVYDTSLEGILKFIFTEIKIDLQYDDTSHLNLERIVKDVKSKCE